MQALFESTGDRGNLFGFTLSREQVRHVQNRLGFQVSLEDSVTAEYEPESWNKIYSIGAWEHVKPEEIVTVLRKLHRALKPDGRLIQHFFCLNRRDLPTYMIAGQVFFPGSQFVSWEEQVEAFRMTGFTMSSHTNHDYRSTLEAWYWNLADRADEALQIVDLQTYNQFLTFFPVAWRFFNEGVAQVHRFLLLKET